MTTKTLAILLFFLGTALQLTAIGIGIYIWRNGGQAHLIMIPLSIFGLMITSTSVILFVFKK